MLLGFKANDSHRAQRALSPRGLRRVPTRPVPRGKPFRFGRLSQHLAPAALSTSVRSGPPVLLDPVPVFSAGDGGPLYLARASRPRLGVGASVISRVPALRTPGSSLLSPSPLLYVGLNWRRGGVQSATGESASGPDQHRLSRGERSCETSLGHILGQMPLHALPRGDPTVSGVQLCAGGWWGADRRELLPVDPRVGGAAATLSVCTRVRPRARARARARFRPRHPQDSSHRPDRSSSHRVQWQAEQQTQPLVGSGRSGPFEACPACESLSPLRLEWCPPCPCVPSSPVLFALGPTLTAPGVSTGPGRTWVGRLRQY